MFVIGDIVKIYAPVAGKVKYHLCVKPADPPDAALFIFLNSDPNHDGCFCVPCERVPCIPVSETGMTAFSLTMLPRYNTEDFKRYRAEKIGELQKDLSQELLAFARNVRTLPRSQLATVISALEEFGK